MPPAKAAVNFVSVRADLWASLQPITLNAYDLNGDLIGSVTTVDVGRRRRSRSPLAGIHSVELLGTANVAGVAWDDLTFDTHSSPPVCPIPAPAGAMLVMCGLGAMRAFRRLRKRSAAATHPAGGPSQFGGQLPTVWRVPCLRLRKHALPVLSESPASGGQSGKVGETQYILRVAVCHCHPSGFQLPVNGCVVRVRGRSRCGEPPEQFGGDDLVALAIRVVALRHEAVERLAAADAILEAGEAVDEGHAVFAGEGADLLRVLVEGIVRVAEFCTHVRRGRQENHPDPGGLSPGNHRLPRRLRASQADAAVIQAVIDRDHIRPQRQHIALEPRSPRSRSSRRRWR